jgi:hypothetical protein
VRLFFQTVSQFGSQFRRARKNCIQQPTERNIVKKRTKSILTLGLILGALTSAIAQPTIIVLNENGFGTWFPPGAPGPIPLPFSVGPDPSGGVAAPVLIYTVPGPALVPGDILLFENTNAPSDVVRIWQGNQIIFYSDFEAGETNRDLADSGLPGFIQPNNVSVPESGPEGNNSGAFVALPGGPFGGGPGWDGNPVGTDYQIISDIPEPTMFTLAALGAGLALASRSRGSMLARDKAGGSLNPR